MAIKQISKKQAQRNRAVAKIKSELPPFCFICHRHTVIDAAHLLPKSIYPEHYTNPLNIVGLCRDCHNSYDNDLLFRQQQDDVFKRICEFDERSAIRYFQL
ncbi:hypothetical protein [Dysgonomonas sp. 37-18]|uniref:hypothetical protein n=1 Tax=Dysgonomonas sp. 37-18 TaxID=1895907 RepID=UPI000925AA41|nr:hypothetical protein [Dysgonomonas sp. 37-18]OJX63060.1 MAG: hypothetical protein BGO84_14240 [Dysgonomonas sp. 37-18]